MSVEAFARALSVRVGNATRKLVLMGYANHAHRDGRHAWCSIETVADYAECDPRTAQRHIARLLADGFMREGDQAEAIRRSSKPANKLPIVYDIAMDDATRERWRAAYVPDSGKRAKYARAGATGGRAAAANRAGKAWGDNLTPQDPGTPQSRPAMKPQVNRGDNLTPQDSGPRRGDNRGHSGVTESGLRGDTAMSPDPSLNRPLNRQPKQHMTSSCVVADADDDAATADGTGQPSLRLVVDAGSGDAPGRRPAPADRGTRIPADFTVTAEMVAWARAKAPHVDGRAETERFADYWAAKAGREGRKLDWTATWRNWMRTAEERAVARHAGPAPRGAAAGNVHQRDMPDDEVERIGALFDGSVNGKVINRG